MRTPSRPRLALTIAVLVALASVLTGACSTFSPPAWQVGDVSMSVDEFYAEFARSIEATKASAHRAITNTIKNRPDFAWKARKHFAWFFARTWRYQWIHRDPQSFLRDEEGLLNGPGARAGLTYQDVHYPDGSEHTNPEAAEPASGTGQLVRLRIPHRIWADDLPPAPAPAARQALGAE